MTAIAGQPSSRTSTQAPTQAQSAVESASLAAAQRLALIERARRAVIDDEAPPPAHAVEPWIARSWQRCLAMGQRPQHKLGFDLVSSQDMRRTREANHLLAQAARPQLEKLARAIAQTRYFAILTNAHGVVVDAEGPIDRADRRATLITRVGVDLSERAVGTTAIGAALTELQPVWLHRGEHFFADTGVYTCAGAPVFGPDGSCAGMLDLTGIEATERPELRHLAAHYARGIENALLLAQPHSLLLRLCWPGRLGGEDDGLLILDDDGHIRGMNVNARQMLALPVVARAAGRVAHVSDVFAMDWGLLFDAARREAPGFDAPLWSGLRLQARAVLARRERGAGGVPPPVVGEAAPLKDIEAALIRRAVDDAHGNVAEAARLLGISRATVYRKLGKAH